MKKKESSIITTYATFILVSIFGFYGYFSLGNIVGLIIGIITLLFLLFLIFTKVHHKIKIKTDNTSDCIHFKNLKELENILNTYTINNKFDFLLASEEKEPVSKKYIDEFETKYDIKLPEILKEFYLSYNQCITKECRFSIYNKDIQFCVCEMVILKYGTYPVEKLLDYVKNNSEISDNFIPIAIDEDYEYYYWDKESKKVYFVSTENVEHPIPICNSIEDFFKLLNYSKEKNKESENCAK